MNLIKHIALVSAVALVPAWALAQTTAPGAGTPPATKGESGKGERGRHGERMKAADKDGDGAISKAEADASGMTRLSQNFDKLDANKDGKVTRDEMRAATKGERGRHGERMKAADKDGDGAISKAEADAAGMTHLSQNFAKLDANKDGKVTRDEMKMARHEHRGEHKGGHMGGHKGANAPGATPATPAAPATK